MSKQTLTFMFATVAIAAAAIIGAVVTKAYTSTESERLIADLESKGCWCMAFPQDDWMSLISQYLPGCPRGGNRQLNSVCAGQIAVQIYFGRRVSLFGSYDNDRGDYVAASGEFDVAWLCAPSISESLQTLCITERFLRWDNPPPAARFQLSMLKVNGCRSINGSIGSLLIASPSLERLELRYTTLTASDVDAIGALPNLKELELTGSNVDERIFDVLPKLRILKSVDLSGTNISEVDPKKFDSLPALEYLFLIDTFVPDEMLDELEQRFKYVYSKDTGNERRHRKTPVEMPGQ